MPAHNSKPASSLSRARQVHVKLSALFRASGVAPPFADLAPRLAALLRSYGASRLLWGSDFPFVLPGGFPLPDGVTQTPARMSYAQAAKVPAAWSLPEEASWDAEALGALMGGNAAKLFGFE